MSGGRNADATVKEFTARKFAYERADGSVVRWQQEDESTVRTREYAVAMVQRMIDFWVPKIAHDIHTENKIPLPRAADMAHTVFRETMPKMLSEPFAQHWQLTMDNFTIPTEIE